MQVAPGHYQLDASIANTPQICCHNRGASPFDQLHLDRPDGVKLGIDQLFRYAGSERRYLLFSTLLRLIKNLSNNPRKSYC